MAIGNVVDSGMTALIDETLPCWKPKKEWKFNGKSWIKELINWCFSQIKQNTAYLMHLCTSFLIFISTLKGIGQINYIFL